MKIFLTTLCLILSLFAAKAQSAFTRADTLRGAITPEREWWDLLHYDLHVRFTPKDSSIRGHNTIRYKVKTERHRMQIDLMQPLVIDSIVQNNSSAKFQREGNVFLVQLTAPQPEGSIQSVTVFYHGKPRVATRPPWDGGVIWAKDKKGRPWISIACQGLGSSVWYPCKDHQADKPDSVAIHIAAPDPLRIVANGKMKGIVVRREENEMVNEATWIVKNPINNYNIIPYIGYYVNFEEVYAGENGPLQTSYWVLDYNLSQAQTHLRTELRRTLKSLEYWFGPYPFYEDSYKIVDAPHLGMEHQSAIAYGNGYQNGYLGTDLSQSGWGLKWDFIVVHESAHEWFGNNITSRDIADSWVHESFANYSETLFTSQEYGIEAGNDYVIGTRKKINNDIPIIARYHLNAEGSSDMYYKGGNMIHMIRQIVNDDEKFRQILRGLNRDFARKTVTTAEIENYISAKSGVNLSKVFDQYLRTTQIPVLNYTVGTERRKTYLVYFWTQCVEGFDMPLKISVAPGKSIWIKPLTKIQKLKLKSAALPLKIVDRNFYVGEENMIQPVIQRN